MVPFSLNPGILGAPINCVVASFTASNQIGEQMKKAAKEKEDEEKSA